MLGRKRQRVQTVPSNADLIALKKTAVVIIESETLLIPQGDIAAAVAKKKYIFIFDHNGLGNIAGSSDDTFGFRGLAGPVNDVPAC